MPHRDLSTPALSLGIIVAFSGCTAGGTSVREKSRALVSDAPVFINELHYDNSGTDTGEAIEVAAPAGTDLSAYALVLYNGANGLAYDTVQLAGVVPDQNNGFGTLVFSFPTNGIQNGSPDGIALVSGDSVLSFLSYEGAFTAVEGPAFGMTSTDIGVIETGSTPVGFSLQLTGTGLSAADFVWAAPAAASFGVVNDGQFFGESGGGSEGPVLGDCGEEVTAIGEVQGPGFESPLVGKKVVVEGVVVADFQGGGAELSGFHLQSETPDSDPATSEGIFIFDGSAPELDVSLGDRVRVLGTVSEYFGLTELNLEDAITCGEGALPEPVSLPLPHDGAAMLESLEGMLVSAGGLVVTEVFDLGRYGELRLSSGSRLFHPNNGGSTDNALSRILLDDARDWQNVEPVAYLAQDGTLRLGDTVGDFQAVLSYGFDVYRLQPVDRSAVVFARTNPRAPVPPAVGGDLKIASLNVLNYFTTLGERGADTSEELERQRAKLVSAIIGLDADVLGLMEVENNDSSGVPVALRDLVSSVNAELGSEVYASADDPAFTGTDAIRTALIYKRARISLLPDAALSGADPIFSRPPIAQGFSFQGNRFSVVVNHFKSKGSCPDDGADPNADFGQGCWNVLRTQQAQALTQFIAELQGAMGDQDVVVLGDLNSYLEEDPVLALEASGLTNWHRTLLPEERYTYVFFGEAGTLDYGMTTSSVPVAGFGVWHINADEPRLLDYNTEFNPTDAYVPDAFRSSDHDPVLLGLELEAQPLNVVRDLQAATAEAIKEAGLTRVAGVLLSVPLRVIEELLEIEAKFENGSRTIRAIAANRTRAFARRVESLVGEQILSEEQAAPLLEQAELLLQIL